MAMTPVLRMYKSLSTHLRIHYYQDLTEEVKFEMAQDAENRMVMLRGLEVLYILYFFSNIVQ